MFLSRDATMAVDVLVAGTAHGRRVTFSARVPSHVPWKHYAIDVCKIYTYICTSYLCASCIHFIVNYAWSLDWY